MTTSTATAALFRHNTPFSFDDDAAAADSINTSNDSNGLGNAASFGLGDSVNDNFAHDPAGEHTTISDLGQRRQRQHRIRPAATSTTTTTAASTRVAASASTMALVLTLEFFVCLACLVIDGKAVIGVGVTVLLGPCFCLFSGIYVHFCRVKVSHQL